MDPVNPTINYSPNNTENQNKFQELLKKKWLLAAVGVVIVFLFSLIFILQSVSQQKSQPVLRIRLSPAPSDSFKQATFVTSQPQQSPEMKKAIEEAKKSSQEYDDWQASVLTNYPWIRKLPLATDKYFVYFDINKKVFVGKLYIKPGDNVEQIKADILQQLKDVKGVPVEKYQFEWTVIPS